MAISTEKNAETFLNIVADTAIANDFPLYAEDELEVIYGLDSLTATLNVDYTVALAPDDYDTFSVTPLPALITKIDALIAADTDGVEINYITVRRKLDYLTSVQPETVRLTNFLSREIERIHMRFQQIAEELDRALVIPGSKVGVPGTRFLVEDPIDGKALVWDQARGTFINGPDANDIISVGDNAANAAASAAAAVVAQNAAAASAAVAATYGLQNKTDATTAPTVDNDTSEGYAVGSRWVDITGDESYICLDATDGAAVWVNSTLTSDELGALAVQDEVTFALLASALLASQAQAEAGTATNVLMTPEQTNQAIQALTPPPTGRLLAYEVFTASGTWTKPAGCNAVKVTVTGGGGGGGVTQNGGANGSTGGTSSFGAHCSATGGGGGVNAYQGNGGDGGEPGVGSSGDLNLPGGHGGTGGATGGTSTTQPYGKGGDGGASYWGGGGHGGPCDEVPTSSSASDYAGAAYGSGGGGASGYSLSGDNNGNGGGASAGTAIKHVTSGLGATEVVTVGGAGSGGNRSGLRGGNGAAGIVIVEAYS